MDQNRNSYYLFLGVHSFLIGLFPFFIPVYLYDQAFSLAHISGFIGLTGLGFCIGLYCWDRARQVMPFHHLISLSFISELALLSCFFLDKNLLFIAIAGILNGIFNCNFWINQRLLFVERVTPQNSGKKFGNFQIFVLLVLKSAIFIGGLLLEQSGFLSLFLLSAVLCAVASLFFLRQKMVMSINEPLPLRALIKFRDRLHSRPIFILDGVFLYLESYFWVISLFLIVQESFWHLGILIIVLTLLFGLIFTLIKNKIDRLPANTLYKSAILLYSLSWLLRALVSEQLELHLLLILLALITFCTSFFRLAFNKRFFDIAKGTKPQEYIIIKSYFSQFFLGVFFLLLPIFFSGENVTKQLTSLYLGFSVVASGYLLYKKKCQGPDSIVSKEGGIQKE